jgi:hypothetical protein
MSTKISPLAGKPAPLSMLVNVPRLVTAYYAERPDPSIAALSAPTQQPETASKTNLEGRRL